MKKLRLTRIIGIKQEHLKELLSSDQISYNTARLIPLLKTGDEMALTSILLSTFRLVKEFRQMVFKELGLPRTGIFYFLTEVCFPEISKERIDGLIIVVKSGKVHDALILEMKKGREKLTSEQMEKYQNIARKIKIPRIASISNQFVSDSSQLPYTIKRYKSIEVFHFSWTYLLTLGRILLFKNDHNIDDADQVEIMKEVLYYFEGEKSGVQSMMRMPSEWKDLTEDIRAHKPISSKGNMELAAVKGWFQMEKHLALKLSQELGVLVKTKNRSKDSIKNEIQFVEKHRSIRTRFGVKNAVSDIVVEADFEKRNVKQSVNIVAPATGTNTSKINWLMKQLLLAKKRKPELYNQMFSKVYVEAFIKYARKPHVVRLDDIESLKSLNRKEEIKDYRLYVVRDLGNKFISQTGFLKEMEEFILEFYAGYIEHLKNWTKPAPKIDDKNQNVIKDTDKSSGTIIL